MLHKLLTYKKATLHTSYLLTNHIHMRNCVYCFLSTRCFTIFTYCFCLSFKLITQPDESIMSFIRDFKVVCIVIWFEKRKHNFTRFQLSSHDTLCIYNIKHVSNKDLPPCAFTDSEHGCITTRMSEWPFLGSFVKARFYGIVMKIRMP